MKQTIYILSALMLILAVSCEKGAIGTDGPGGAGDSGIRFPAGNTYDNGDDVIIICSGILPDAVFYLVRPDGSRIAVENVTVTDSGIFFTLNVTAGEYTVIVEQNGESFELGKITATVPSIDVTVNNVPSYCLPGGSISVSGTGFDETAALAIVAPDGTRTILDTETSGTGLTASVPADAPRGKLSLLIVQDNGEKTISDAFFITSVKYLVKLNIQIGSGNSAFTREFSFTRDESGHVTATVPYTMTVSDGNDAEHGEYTAYDFAATEDEEEMSYYPFLLKVSKTDGRVLSSTFETERTDPDGNTVTREEEFDWEYDSYGFLSWYVGKYTYEFVSDGENINLEDLSGNGIYAYENPGLVNNPFGVDGTLGLLAAEDADHIMSVALALGFTGRRSETLPSGRKNGSTTDPIDYTFDSEGYVTGASYGENGPMPVKVEYTYE